MNDAEYLISCLSEKLNINCAIPDNDTDQFILFRSLCSELGSNSIDDDYFYEVQDRYLQSLNKLQKIVDVCTIVPVFDRCCVVKCSPTALKADAIVNATGERILGYIVPCFKCIEYAIHSRAGISLAAEIKTTEEYATAFSEVNATIITSAHNLPSKYIIHPRTSLCSRPVQNLDPDDLLISYRNCLHLAWLNGVNSIAFCITLNELSQFTKFEVASLIVSAVIEWLDENPNYDIKVLFDVLTDEDADIFTDMLKKYKNSD